MSDFPGILRIFMQRLYLVHSANEKFCEKKDMAITMTIITIATMTIITTTCIGEKEIRQGEDDKEWRAGQRRKGVF